jgi:Co/Zn/Cd efflux system component
MEFWFPTATYIAIGTILFVISIGVVAVLKARHPNERNEAFLWAKAQRIGGVILVVALIGSLIFITFRYS